MQLKSMDIMKILEKKMLPLLRAAYVQGAENYRDNEYNPDEFIEAVKKEGLGIIKSH